MLGQAFLFYLCNFFDCLILKKAIFNTISTVSYYLSITYITGGYPLKFPRNRLEFDL